MEVVINLYINLPCMWRKDEERGEEMEMEILFYPSTFFCARRIRKYVCSTHVRSD